MGVGATGSDSGTARLGGSREWMFSAASVSVGSDLDSAGRLTTCDNADGACWSLPQSMPDVADRLAALVFESNEMSLGTVDSDADVLTEAVLALFSSWLSSRPPRAVSIETVLASTIDSSWMVSRLGLVRRPRVGEGQSRGWCETLSVWGKNM